MKRLDPLTIGMLAVAFILALPGACNYAAAAPANEIIVGMYQDVCRDGVCVSLYLGEAPVGVDELGIPGIEEMSCNLHMVDADGDGVPAPGSLLVCIDPSFGEHQVEVDTSIVDRDDGDPEVQ